MSFKLCAINSLVKYPDERIIDYAFISEENFLLVILLTSRANIILLHRSANVQRLESASLASFFRNRTDYCVVSVTPDAAVIVLLLLNDDVFLLPLKCLMDFQWGKKSAITHKPLRFSASCSDSLHSSPSRAFATNNEPIDAFCFVSSIGRTYFVIGYKSGLISLVDLNLRSICAKLSLPEGIQSVEYYYDETKASRFVLVTHRCGSQYLIPLELAGSSVRETLSHVIPSHLIDIAAKRHHVFLQNFCRSSTATSLVCVLDEAESMLRVYSDFSLNNFVDVSPIAQLKLPKRKFLIVQYTPRLVTLIPERSSGISVDNEIFVKLHFLTSNNSADYDSVLWNELPKKLASSSSSGDGSGNFEWKVFAILPQCQDSKLEQLQLEECLIITSSGLFWLRSSLNVSLVVATHLTKLPYVSADVLHQIAKNLSLQPTTFYENVFGEVLKQRQNHFETFGVYPDNSVDCEYFDACFLDGLLSLGFELQFNVERLMEILATYNAADLLLPFLCLRCEKEGFSDTKLRQMLFNAYMSKLWKVNQALDSRFGFMKSSVVDDRRNHMQNKQSCRFDDDLRLQQLIKEKDLLEYEIKHFLIKFHSTNVGACSGFADMNASNTRGSSAATSPEILSMLLKHSLWSCIAVVLSQDSTPRSSTVVAHYLIAMPTWTDMDNSTFHCLPFLQWSAMGESVARPLVARMLNLLPTLTACVHIQILVDAAEQLLERSMEFALPLYVAGSIALLIFRCGTVPCSLEYSSVLNSGINHDFFERKLSCGSNCALGVADDGAAVFWGEFSAGASLHVSGGDALFSTTARKQRRTPFALGSNLGFQSEMRKESRGSPRTTSSVLIPNVVQLPKDEFGKEYKIKSVACGTEHVLLLTVDCNLLSWGRNRYGQCGNGTNQPIDYSTLIDGDWRTESSGGVCAIFAGHYHSAMIDSRASVWTWGWGMYGQLATGNNIDHWRPIKIAELSGLRDICLGYAHSLFLDVNGTVRGCGASGNGQLGGALGDSGEVSNDVTRNDTLTRQKVFTLDVLQLPGRVTHLSSKYFHAVAVCEVERDNIDDDNNRSTIGSHHENFVSSTDSGTAAESCGKNCPCYRRTAATTVDIYEWGECPQTLRMQTFLAQRLRGNRNSTGGSGEVTTSSHSGKTESNESSNLTTDCAIDKRNSVNGPSNDDILSTPVTPISSARNQSKASSRLLQAVNTDLRPFLRLRKRCSWPPTVTSNSGAKANESTALVDSDIRQVSAGYNHSALLTAEGRLYTWGKALDQQLGYVGSEGNGNTTLQQRRDQELPTEVPEPRGFKWAYVECARCFTCAISEDGRVYAWGRNDKQQLGLGKRSGQSGTSKKRRIVIKSKGGAATRCVELPSNETSVGTPTLLHGLQIRMRNVLSVAQIESMVARRLWDSSQLALILVSKHFIRHPLSEMKALLKVNEISSLYDSRLVLPWLIVTDAHLLAGDLLHAVNALTYINAFLLNERRRQLDISDGVVQDTHCISEANNRTLEKFVSDNSTSVVSCLERSFSSPRRSIVSSTAPTTAQMDILMNTHIMGNTCAASLAISSCHKKTTTPSISLSDRFDVALDRVWTMLSSHPQRSVQTLCTLRLLIACFPVFHRLAADVRLCRAIEPYLSTTDAARFRRDQWVGGSSFSTRNDVCPTTTAVSDFSAGPTKTSATIPSTSKSNLAYSKKNIATSPSSSSASMPLSAKNTSHNRPAAVRITELGGIRERYIFLKGFFDTGSRPTDGSDSVIGDVRSLTQRCEQSAGRLRYYAACGHYETCVVESGAQRQAVAALRNRLRCCTRCVTRHMSSGSANTLPPPRLISGGRRSTTVGSSSSSASPSAPTTHVILSSRFNK